MRLGFLFPLNARYATSVSPLMAASEGIFFPVLQIYLLGPNGSLQI